MYVPRTCFQQAAAGISAPYYNCRTTVFQLRYARMAVAVRPNGNCRTPTICRHHHRKR
ncbi:MAG: hypothetical protein ACI3YO_01540 [Prevotella sp.]